MTRHSIVGRSRPRHRSTIKILYIYIYTRTRAKATNARPINFVFPIPGGEEFFVMQICSFKREEEEEEGRSDRHASKGSRFLSTDLVLFVFIPPLSLPPVLRGKQLRVKGKKRTSGRDAPVPR